MSLSYTPIPMLPGPVTVHPNVLKVLGQAYNSDHYSDEFMALYAATSKNIAQLLETTNDIILMTGESMLALWGALKSCLSKGDRVVSISTGVFGDAIGEMAASFGCIVEKISFPYDSTIDKLNIIEKTIRQLRPVMLTAVHCETPSGTLNPLELIGNLKKELKVPLFYVDAVASVGGVPIQTDAWNIDLLLGGSQKCLSAPPNISIVAVSQIAWDYIKKVNYQGYDAILPFQQISTDFRYPYTPYWHGIAALNLATQHLLEEGKEHVFARHAYVAKQCRAGLKKLGITLWPRQDAINSPTITAAMIPHGFNWLEWNQRLLQHGLVCAGSSGPMYNKVFRLGHMGTQAQESLINQAIKVIASVI